LEWFVSDSKSEYDNLKPGMYTKGYACSYRLHFKYSTLLGNIIKGWKTKEQGESKTVTVRFWGLAQAVCMLLEQVRFWLVGLGFTSRYDIARAMFSSQIQRQSTQGPERRWKNSP